MNDYPYDSIRLNGRNITITDILTSKAEEHSPFESSSLQFIRDWLTGQDHYVIMTSGSTGKPKEITITRDQMIASARATEKALELQTGYVALICLDTRYVAGKMMIVRSFVTGMQMQLNEPEGNPFARLDTASPVDFVALVPYQVEQIFEASQEAVFDAIRITIIGGAPLNSATATAVSHRRTHAFLTYGMTETISHVALCSLNKGAVERVFELLPGIQIGLDDRGCLTINGPYLPETVVTNDLVEIIFPNRFRWLGRWDNVINTGGVKVHPEKIEFQIEKILRELGLNAQFFIAGIADQKTGQRVVLVIERQEDKTVRQSLENRLKTVLNPFERPRTIIFITPFITTATGKINRPATLDVISSQKN